MRQWAAFAGLGLIWGSSFLWIKYALLEVGPITLASCRMLFGLLVLVLIMKVRGIPFPFTRKKIPAYLFMGILNTALPFSLISWGETRIPSGMTSVLNGTVPLFTLVLAHLWLHDEKFTLGRALGLVLGFAGVLILMSKGIQNAENLGSIWGQLAVLCAAFMYALAATFSRRHLRAEAPLTQASLSLLAGGCFLWPLLAVLRWVHPELDTNHASPASVGLLLPTHAFTWLALAWLGVLGSGIAYLLFFYLIQSWGPARASLVTYVFPVVGILLGWIFLGEVPDLRLGVGAALIVGGIVVVKRA